MTLITKLQIILVVPIKITTKNKNKQKEKEGGVMIDNTYYLILDF